MVKDAQSELDQDEYEHDDADDLVSRIEFLGLLCQPVSKVTNILFRSYFPGDLPYCTACQP